MSLYNAIYGTHPLAPLVLSVLNQEPKDFGRFRDAMFDSGRMLVRARVGYGNRADYLEVFDLMRSHPLYAQDAEDDFDPTYVNFWFRIPKRGDGYVIGYLPEADAEPELVEVFWSALETMRESPPALTLKEMTDMTIEKMKNTQEPY